jgi:hypothetical protein
MMNRLLTLSFTTLIALASFGRLVPIKDPLNGVLDAEAVVIVRPALLVKPDSFEVEEVLLGSLSKREIIEVPSFKLSTTHETGPERIEPMTSGTRILLYLEHPKDSPRSWQPTFYRQSFFWVRRPQDTPVLRRAAERSLEVSQAWESAAKISNPKERVAALWPYLEMQKFGLSFFEHTKVELENARPASGEYFAAHFDSMSHNERMSLLPDAGSFGSDALREKLEESIKQQEHIYEKFVAEAGKKPGELDLNAIPGSAIEAGEMYYGLAGLARYRDRSDLPFLRTATLWAAQYHMEQVASAGVLAFGEMPDRANLPAIESVLREFLPERVPRMGTLDFETERVLCRHKYPETVPLLALFLGDDSKQLASEAESCLTEIAGKDLGKDQNAWFEWYRRRNGATEH